MYLLYLVLRDEIENLLYQILNFENGTRNKKGFLVIEREFSSLILTRFFEIENSRQCLMCFCLIIDCPAFGFGFLGRKLLVRLREQYLGFSPKKSPIYNIGFFTPILNQHFLNTTHCDNPNMLAIGRH